ELYFFTNETDSIKYEAIQSDIIEHVYAIMPRFDLRAFQYANSSD
ncbi:MAG: mechanosensitive ion channel family protein, partial [Tatlockia sp.]|nr:mechanosensitive ion channel family protein [Tatlockia sp.]